jgi:hypothetical protein
MDNPYTGGGHRQAAAYNYYTGKRAVGHQAANPVTGTHGESQVRYTAYTGNAVDSEKVYNPYTGRYGHRYGVRHY